MENEYCTTIEELVEKYGLSNGEIAKRFDIPARTVRSWTSDSASTRTCPAYVVALMDECLAANGNTRPARDNMPE